MLQAFRLALPISLDAERILRNAQILALSKCKNREEHEAEEPQAGSESNAMAKCG